MATTREERGPARLPEMQVPLLGQTAEGAPNGIRSETCKGSSSFIDLEDPMLSRTLILQG